MEDRDLKLLREDIRTETIRKGSLPIPLQKKQWLKRHRNGISGVVCILLSGLLPFLLWQQASSKNFFWLSFVIVVFAIYCLVKGIFTLLFHAKENQLGTGVHQYLLANAYNRLYFIYEKMVWLWFLLPLTIAMLSVFIPLNKNSIYWLLICGIYSAVLLCSSRPLWRRMRQVREEIKQLNE